NNEGFAIAPQAECVGGLKSVFWADDSATNGHAIRSGKLNCTAASAPTPTPTPTPAPGANPTPTPAPGVNPTPAPGTNPTPTPVPGTNQTPTVPGTGTPNVFKPVLSALKKSAKASKTGTLKLKISCVIAGTGASSPTSCEGSVKLSAKIGGKKKTLGSASFKLAGGKQKELSVKLNAATRTALRRGALKATVSSTVGKQTATKALTLNRVR
ncbi:MAG: hypothetical protein Q7T55_01755, partial [Solirubrobacteraceae bacterium]|nr:hypothetical protein [Solirubrobacteraceae bacterium]